MELVLDFERPIVELYRRIASLRVLEEEEGVFMYLFRLLLVVDLVYLMRDAEQRPSVDEV